MLSYAPVLLAASLVVGQADQRSQDDDFKKLRAFTGTWEAKDVEAVGGVGDVLVSWKPILDGRFIEHRYVFKLGATTRNSVGLRCLDAIQRPARSTDGGLTIEAASWRWS